MPMAENQIQPSVGRFEFYLIVGQLFLWIGLLGLATVLDGSSGFTSILKTVLKFVVVFGSFGISMFYTFSAMAVRPKKSKESNPSQPE